VPAVITSDYYAQPKVLVVHAFNNSGKDITGYTIILRHKNPDGALGTSGWTENTSDMLSVLITTQMAKDPPLRNTYGSKTSATTLSMPQAMASSSQAKPAT
jgi:hypothetical protein